MHHCCRGGSVFIHPDFRGPAFDPEGCQGREINAANISHRVFSVATGNATSRATTYHDASSVPRSTKARDYPGGVSSGEAAGGFQSVMVLGG